MEINGESNPLPIQRVRLYDDQRLREAPRLTFGWKGEYETAKG